MPFWFGKKKPPSPEVPPQNKPADVVHENKPPSEIVAGKVAFARAGKSWEESFDVVDNLSKQLDQQGVVTARKGNVLTLESSGYVLGAVMISFKPLDNGGSQTCTIIRISHPQLMPEQIFEYQHSTGSSLNESLSKGFSQWAQMDLLTLLACLESKPTQCTFMELGLPAKDGLAERNRRIILGPVAHLRLTKPDPAEEHPFCPCCLVTNTLKVFMPLVEGPDLLGIRLFAMRNHDGSIAADCRVNGQEFEPGKEALREYVGKWPPNGVEFRKQYVVVQTAAK